MASESKRRAGRPTPTQARAARRARRQRRRRVFKIFGFIAIAVLAAVFILSLFAGGLHQVFSPRNAPSGPGVRIGDLGATHIFVGESHPAYNSVPATSGWHYTQPDAPARWGVHDEVLPDEVLLHNLEHGGVGIQYNCPKGCDELVAQLEDITKRASKVVMSPYPGMDTRIALIAWTFIDQFEVFDKDRIDEFVSAHVGSDNSPEPFAR